MMCMIKFKMIFQSALITSLCLLLCACRADDPETVTPEYAAQSEEPDMLPEETAKKPEQVLLEQLVDDTHDAFLVDTGGELGTLLVTAELDEETPTEDCRATIQFTVWDPYSMDEPLQTLTAGTDIFLDWSIIDANFDGYMDFACTYLRGNQPYYDHLWIWNEYDKRFDSIPEYDNISVPTLY